MSNNLRANFAILGVRNDNQLAILEDFKSIDEVNKRISIENLHKFINNYKHSNLDYDKKNFGFYDYFIWNASVSYIPNNNFISVRGIRFNIDQYVYNDSNLKIVKGKYDSTEFGTVERTINIDLDVFKKNHYVPEKDIIIKSVDDRNLLERFIRRSKIKTIKSLANHFYIIKSEEDRDNTMRYTQCSFFTHNVDYRIIFAIDTDSSTVSDRNIRYISR